jgi:hypothetical protein
MWVWFRLLSVLSAPSAVFGRLEGVHAAMNRGSGGVNADLPSRGRAGIFLLRVYYNLARSR